MKEGVPTFVLVTSGVAKMQDAADAVASVVADETVWGLTWLEMLERSLYRLEGATAVQGFYIGDPRTGWLHHWIDTNEGQKIALQNALNATGFFASVKLVPEVNEASSKFLLFRNTSPALPTLTPPPFALNDIEAELAAKLGPRKPTLNLRAAINAVLEAWPGALRIVIDQRNVEMECYFYNSPPALIDPNFGGIPSSWVFRFGLDDYPL